MLSPVKPQSGNLLVSEPFMLDPNFKRSVVLLTEYQAAGAVGFILNQRSNLLLNDLIEDISLLDFPVYIGGPVANDSLHFVHNCHDKLNSGVLLREGVYWGGNFETLRILLKNNEIGREEIKFFIGYSGWSEGQLEQEIQENSWLVSNKFHHEVVFVQDDENLWREVVIGLGPKYAHIANFPENPQWN